MTSAVALPPSESTPRRGRDLTSLILRTAAEIGWSARREGEPLANRRERHPPDRLYYRAPDGWEAPLWRYPPRPGGGGEPLILSHGLGLGSGSLDLREESSLARAAWERGYDVYLVEHRGDLHALPPAPGASFDFDDLVDQDVPAILDAVLHRSRFHRAMWIGHALGGQLLYGHLARAGSERLAAGISLCAPVRFTAPPSALRAAAMVSQLIPPSWSVPGRQLHRMLAPSGSTGSLGSLAADTSGPDLRGLMLDGMGDVHAGLVRQMSRWLTSGWMSDRHDRFDYTAGMKGQRLPMMLLSAGGDRLCPPAAVRPVAEVMDGPDLRWVELPDDWSHLDVLVGRRAAQVVHPLILDWLEQHRSACGFPAPPPDPGPRGHASGGAKER